MNKQLVFCGVEPLKQESGVLVDACQKDWLEEPAGMEGDGISPKVSSRW